MCRIMSEISSCHILAAALLLGYGKEFISSNKRNTQPSGHPAKGIKR